MKGVTKPGALTFVFPDGFEDLVEARSSAAPAIIRRDKHGYSAGSALPEGLGGCAHAIQCFQLHLLRHRWQGVGEARIRIQLPHNLLNRSPISRLYSVLFASSFPGVHGRDR